MKTTTEKLKTNDDGNNSCSQCNEAQASDSDSFWEDGNGGQLCQMCWESTSDAEWWNRLRDIEIQIHNQIKT